MLQVRSLFVFVSLFAIWNLYLVWTAYFETSRRPKQCCILMTLLGRVPRYYEQGNGNEMRLEFEYRDRKRYGSQRRDRRNLERQRNRRRWLGVVVHPSRHIKLEGFEGREWHRKMGMLVRFRKRYLVRIVAHRRLNQGPRARAYYGFQGKYHLRNS